MKAFVEIVYRRAECQIDGPDLIGIIRVGREAEKYGDPFEHGAVFVANAGIATVKALTASDRYTVAHHRAGIAALEEIGLKSRLDRYKRKTNGSAIPSPSKLDEQSYIETDEPYPDYTEDGPFSE